MNKSLLALLVFACPPLLAAIPATPVMTLYGFNSEREVPYYEIESFLASGTASPAGTLAQGTSLIPCLVIHQGAPLTDASGTPFVGFELVVDARMATPAATQAFQGAVEQRRSHKVDNHHCAPGVKQVINVRKLYALTKAPFFDPPASGGSRADPPGKGQLDQIIRAFHNSPSCAGVNRDLIGRRGALASAWDQFISNNPGRWPRAALVQAKHLDYSLRTAIFEGHLDRGCNAYGACERNVIALTIRNRGQESCASRYGCDYPGDFQGVASKVSQYNIWDEYLTQISGLTSCYLRSDLGKETATSVGKEHSQADYYHRLQRSYEQNLSQVERILYGPEGDLREIFPGTPVSALQELRHYYHAPAMGKCFPDDARVEYISGALARNGKDFALIADTRVRVDQKTEGGYRFRQFQVQEEPESDLTSVVDSYPGFLLDARKVSLKGSSGCRPYGIPQGCDFGRIGRYRKTPSWLDAGTPLEIHCQVMDQGELCRGPGRATSVALGGRCDTQMRPVTGIR